jgi:hypothetical protein
MNHHLHDLKGKKRSRATLPAAATVAIGITAAALAAAPAAAQSLAISIGVRETGTAEAIGGNGGTAGSIEWVRQDGQFLPFDGGWHQFTFSFGSDPVTAMTGNGVLDGTRGTLEHLRIRNVAGITDPITLYIDHLVHTVAGTPITMTDFESSEPAAPTVGDNEVMFRNPKFSGSTEPFVLPGATSRVSDLHAHSGSQALKLDWTFVNGVTTNWVRDTTFNSPKYPNPAIDFTAGNTLSFWMRAEIGAPAQRWINTGGGNWDEPGNWGTGVVPNAANAVANFLNDVTQDATITLNNPITVNTIRLNSDHNYTFVGGPGNNSLTLAAPAESSQNINVERGNHTFVNDVHLQATAGTFGVANFNVARGSDVLRFNGEFTVLNITPLTVFKQGPGRVEMRKIEATGDAEFSPLDLRVSQGVLRLTTGGGTSRVNALTVTTAAASLTQLDLTSNAMVVDYTGPTSPLASIKAQILSAYNAGAWDGNGIASSNANANQFGVGYAEATALTVVPAVFGSVDADAVLMRLTRYGDTDLNGTVNLSDFNRLAANFGSTDAVWSQGDFNYDGLVNLSDFNRLAANFGLSAAGPEVTPEDWSNLAAAIPEPGSLAFVAAGALTLVRRQRRHGSRSV